MFARALLSFHPAPLSDIPQNFAKSNYSRTYEPFPLKSNYSRTYATPGVGVSLLHQSEIIYHAPQVLSLRLLRKNRGMGGLVIPISANRFDSSVLSPVTNHHSPVTSFLTLPRATVACVISNLFRGVLACVNP